MAHLVFGLIRGFLVVVALLVAFVVGAVVIVPLAIFAPPLVAILGGLLALSVLGATESMADDWQERRDRRRAARPAPVRSQARVARPAPRTDP